MKRFIYLLLGGMFGLVFSVYANVGEGMIHEPTITTGEVTTGYCEREPVKEVVVTKPKVTKSNLPEYINETQSIGIKGFPKDSLANQLATRYYREAGRDMLLTMLGENGGFNHLIISPTRDYGLCQLNRAASSPEQREFIGVLSGGVMQFSERFSNPHTQADYCIWKWNVAASKRIRAAYDSRRAHAHKVSIVERDFSNYY